MKTFATSDLHFSHENVIKYCNRPFDSAEEMDRKLIENWNGNVGRDDVVYILGDMFFCNVGKAESIMRQLNGKKRIVLGNHDKLIRKESSLQQLFDRILPDLHEESIYNKRFVMCHYPLLTWNKARYGTIMLHGHVHSRLSHDGKIRRMDVGVDANNYMPADFKNIITMMEKTTATDPRDKDR